jgi:hypothetical protein
VRAAVYAEYPYLRDHEHGENVVVTDRSGGHGARIRHRDRVVGAKVYRKEED